MDIEVTRVESATRPEVWSKLCTLAHSGWEAIFPTSRLVPGVGSEFPLVGMHLHVVLQGLNALQHFSVLEQIQDASRVTTPEILLPHLADAHADSTASLATDKESFESAAITFLKAKGEYQLFLTVLRCFRRRFGSVPISGRLIVDPDGDDSGVLITIHDSNIKFSDLNSFYNEMSNYDRLFDFVSFTI